MPAADHQNVRIDGTIDVVVTATDDETEADRDREAEIEAVDETDTDRDREAATEAADETDTKQYVQNLLQFLANLEKHTHTARFLSISPENSSSPRNFSLSLLSLSFISYPLEQKKNLSLHYVSSPPILSLSLVCFRQQL